MDPGLFSTFLLHAPADAGLGGNSWGGMGMLVRHPLEQLNAEQAVGGDGGRPAGVGSSARKATAARHLTCAFCIVRNFEMVRRVAAVHCIICCFRFRRQHTARASALQQAPLQPPHRSAVSCCAGGCSAVQWGCVSCGSISGSLVGCSSIGCGRILLRALLLVLFLLSGRWRWRGRRGRWG